MSTSRVDGQWFREEDSSWAGYSVSLKIEEILFQGKSDFQDILVFKSTSFGVVLVLNGIIQCTERDERTYQEMIAHLPLNSHPNPQKVLVIGGGDGGVVREALKYKSVSSVVLCEIDQKVIDVCRKFLPSMASCLDDERVTIHVGDGIAYVKDHPGEFDVIITDAPDPIGMAEGLYQKAFYQDMKNALKSDGIMCCQGETTWFDLPLIKRMLKDCRSIFPRVAYAVGNTPTYVGGQMGYMLCSSDPKAKLVQPLRQYSDAELIKMNMQYYSPEIHVASFVLPFFIKKNLQEVLDT
ncbi:spermidine synthase-like [Littorina saxatilis]|uniref:PABS domain-containing protein n=1 Tax=Littorina saxatilis TaxID=31220 RepID=A0AAN9FW71_9CAEN